MRKISCVLFAIWIVCVANEVQPEVDTFDKKIQELQNEKTKLLGRAARLEDSAQRWQFMQDQAHETRRAYRQADLLRQQADILQGEIDQLKQKKAKRLQERSDDG